MKKENRSISFVWEFFHRAVEDVLCVCGVINGFSAISNSILCRNYPLPLNLRVEMKLVSSRVQWGSEEQIIPWLASSRISFSWIFPNKHHQNKQRSNTWVSNSKLLMTAKEFECFSFLFTSLPFICLYIFRKWINFLLLKPQTNKQREAQPEEVNVQINWNICENKHLKRLYARSNYGSFASSMLWS